MRKKIFYRVLPVFSLIFAMFFSVPSFAASSLITSYQYNGVKSYSRSLEYTFAVNDQAVITNISPSGSGPVSYTFGDGSLTIAVPIETLFSLGPGAFSSSSYNADNCPSGATTAMAALTSVTSVNASYSISYGNDSGVASKFYYSVLDGGWYLDAGSGERYIAPFSSSGYRSPVSLDVSSPASEYIAGWRLFFRGTVLFSFYLDDFSGGAFTVTFTPSLSFGSLNWSDPLYFYSGDAPVTDGDIFDQTNTITNGYDNSSLTGSNTDLSGGLNQYENQENEMLGQVDFTSVAMTDVFSLSDFVSSTSLFGTFMQGIFSNLGTANAIIIISLSLMFALAALGYRKYLRG